MAAAEARAAWQRANRCFVQEDAKRAPKLACCPSASMMQNDSSTGSTCSQDHVAPSFMSVSWSTMNPNLSPDAKWWLQLQPHFGYHKDYICEQLSSLAEEFDEEVEIMIPKSKVAAETLLDESVDVDPKNESHLDSPWMVSCKNHGSERNSGIKSVTDYSQEPLKHKVDQIYKDEELLDWKPGDRFMSKRQEKASSCLETPWAAANKSEPWWRITDKDELALLVAQKSLEHIENCDLPKPSQTVHVNTDPFHSVESLDTTIIFPSPLGPKLRSGSTSDYSQNSYTTKKLDDNSSSSDERGHLPHSEKLYCHMHIRFSLEDVLICTLSNEKMVSQVLHLAQKASMMHLEPRMDAIVYPLVLAISCYSKAQLLKPGDVVILSNRSAAFCRISQHLRERLAVDSEYECLYGLDPTTYAELALKDAEKVISIRSDSPKSYFLKANALVLDLEVEL